MSSKGDNIIISIRSTVKQMTDMMWINNSFRFLPRADISKANKDTQLMNELIKMSINHDADFYSVQNIRSGTLISLKNFHFLFSPLGQILLCFKEHRLLTRWYLNKETGFKVWTCKTGWCRRVFTSLTPLLVSLIMCINFARVDGTMSILSKSLHVTMCQLSIYLRRSLLNNSIVYFW